MKRMDPLELKVALAKVGLHETAGVTLDDLVRTYQRVHGLKPDAIAGPVVERHLAEQRFCGNPDRVRTSLKGATPMCRWDATNWDGSKFVGDPVTVTLHYYVAMAAPGCTLDDTKAAVAQAFAEIAKHGAILWTPVDTAAGANIVIAFGRIDGLQGILAQTELPCGQDSPSRVLSFEADSSEVWTVMLPAQGKIYLRAVLTHELLHACGLEHLPTGNLMAPYYSENIYTMQAGDIAELQKRYGPPQNVTPPAPVPSPNPSALDALVRIGTETFTGQLTKSSS